MSSVLNQMLVTSVMLAIAACCSNPPSVDAGQKTEDSGTHFCIQERIGSGGSLFECRCGDHVVACSESPHFVSLLMYCASCPEDLVCAGRSVLVTMHLPDGSMTDLSQDLCDGISYFKVDWWGCDGCKEELSRLGY